MKKNELPLKEVSINELFNGNKATYEIPIYQRNYAWGKDEISTLIQDVYDAYKKDAQKTYFIGTLVSYHKGDMVFEIIDGQQRLTTIRLVLAVFDKTPINELTYRSRIKSDRTLKSIPKFSDDELDSGMVYGYKYAMEAYKEVVGANDRKGFERYFMNNVHIIHYQVPRDIDLNHYFEIMNSRGEQLEKHEIVKAQLFDRIGHDNPNAITDRKVFNLIWEACSNMSVYVQQNLNNRNVFGEHYSDFLPGSFDDVVVEGITTELEKDMKISLEKILSPNFALSDYSISDEGLDKNDRFQPIIDFSNFLLIVLKLYRMDEAQFCPEQFNLDDKELINEFDRVKANIDVKKFAFYLLKARYYLDNYIVHHSMEEDTIDNNPWKLQKWQKGENKKKGYLLNISDDKSEQERLVHLLSMFEVSFTARQRKNYLFYCLYYLFNNGTDVKSYASFVENLADKYFFDVYLEESKLNDKNTPVPGSFDSTILVNNNLDVNAHSEKNYVDFNTIYGDGSQITGGVPLFIFNYADYKIWELYSITLRGEKSKEDSKERKAFFEDLGCSDFGLKVFDKFYFSRTRRSLEHYYPQAMATGLDEYLSQNEINCFGNYAMIGSEANSSGSNWSPKTKLDHYLDSSGKIGQISVASLKFMIMMQMCKDNQEWMFEQISDHQRHILKIMFDDTDKL